MSIIMPLRGKSTLSFTEITHNDMTARDSLLGGLEKVCSDQYRSV